MRDPETEWLDSARDAITFAALPVVGSAIALVFVLCRMPEGHNRHCTGGPSGGDSSKLCPR